MARRRVTGAPAGTTLPTQRTQFVSHAIPEVQSKRAGLEQMGAVFSSFFGQASAALESVQDTIELGQRKQIEQENRAEKLKAQSDFFSGAGPDETLLNDMDYMDTFRGLQATRVASDASRDFMQWYQEDYLPNNRFGDLASARDQWARENLTGFDDPDTQAQVFAKFYDGTDRMLDLHVENGIRFRREEDLANLGVSINDDVTNGAITPERVQWYITAARQIDPLNYNEAAPRVIAGLMASVQSNPASTQQIINTLTLPGTGVNGRSFAESFPDAFAKFQTGAMETFLQTNSLEEYEYFREIEDVIRSSPTLTDEQMIELTGKIAYGRDRWGAGKQADGLKDMLTSRIDAIVEKRGKINLVAGMLDGIVPLDAGHLRANYGDYMEAKYGTKNVLDVDPVMLSNDIARMGGVVPEDVKYQLTNGLTNTADPQAQEKALRILSTVQAARGSEYVQSYLTDEGSRWYKHVQSHLNTNLPLAEATRKVNEARSTGRLAENVDVRAMAGDPEMSLGEANRKVDKQIDKSVQAYFGRDGIFGGTNIVIPDNVKGAIRDYAVTVYAERGTDGVTMDAAVQEAVERYMSQADIVGSEDAPELLLRETGDQVATDEDGIKERVRLGTAVMNPKNGMVVNTWEIYTDELKQMRQAAPNLLPFGEDGEVRIDYQEVIPGAFQVRQGGARVVYEAGDTVIIGDQEITIPDTEEGIKAAFGDVIPKGFGFVAERDMDGKLIGWQMMYTPHFGDYDATVTDMEKGFALSYVRTPEQELNDFANALIAAQRDAGLIPMTTGVSQPLPTFRSGEDIMAFIENEMNRGVASQGRRFIDRHAVSFDQTYRARRMDLLVNKEAIRTAVYDDRTGGRLSPGQSAKGFRTVGVGFNMDRKGAKQTWNEVFGADGPSFDKVYSGEAQITKAQAQRLFEHDMVYFEGVVLDAAGGRTLPENQHLALLSLAYNSPKRVQDMSKYLAIGDHANVMRAMLYESFNPNHPQRQALASRRYQEARMYAGSDPMLRAFIPPLDQYLNHWR